VPNSYQVGGKPITLAFAEHLFALRGQMSFVCAWFFCDEIKGYFDGSPIQREVHLSKQSPIQIPAVG